MTADAVHTSQSSLRDLWCPNGERGRGIFGPWQVWKVTLCGAAAWQRAEILEFWGVVVGPDRRLATPSTLPVTDFSVGDRAVFRLEAAAIRV